MCHDKAGQARANVNQTNSNKNMQFKSSQRGGFYNTHFSFLFDRSERNEAKQQSAAGDPQPPPAVGHVGTCPGGGLTWAAMI